MCTSFRKVRPRVACGDRDNLLGVLFVAAKKAPLTFARGAHERAFSFKRQSVAQNHYPRRFGLNYSFSIFHATNSNAFGTPFRVLRHATGVTNCPVFRYGMNS